MIILINELESLTLTDEQLTSEEKQLTEIKQHGAGLDLVNGALTYFYDQNPLILVPNQFYNAADQQNYLPELISREREHYSYIIFSLAIDEQHQVAAIIDTDNQVIQVIDSQNLVTTSHPTLVKFQSQIPQFTVNVQPSYFAPQAYALGEWSCGMHVVANMLAYFDSQSFIQGSQLDEALFARVVVRAANIATDKEFVEQLRLERNDHIKQVIVKALQQYSIDNITVQHFYEKLIDYLLAECSVVIDPNGIIPDAVMRFRPLAETATQFLRTNPDERILRDLLMNINVLVEADLAALIPDYLTTFHLHLNKVLEDKFPREQQMSFEQLVDTDMQFLLDDMESLADKYQFLTTSLTGALNGVFHDDIMESFNSLDKTNYLKECKHLDLLKFTVAQKILARLGQFYVDENAARQRAKVAPMQSDIVVGRIIDLAEKFPQHKHLTHIMNIMAIEGHQLHRLTSTATAEWEVILEFCEKHDNKGEHLRKFIYSVTGKSVYDIKYHFIKYLINNTVPNMSFFLDDASLYVYAYNNERYKKVLSQLHDITQAMGFIHHSINTVTRHVSFQMMLAYLHPDCVMPYARQYQNMAFFELCYLFINHLLSKADRFAFLSSLSPETLLSIVSDKNKLFTLLEMIDHTNHHDAIYLFDSESFSLEIGSYIYYYDIKSIKISDEAKIALFHRMDNVFEKMKLCQHTPALVHERPLLFKKFCKDLTYDDAIFPAFEKHAFQFGLEVTFIKVAGLILELCSNLYRNTGINILENCIPADCELESISHLLLFVLRALVGGPLQAATLELRKELTTPVRINAVLDVLDSSARKQLLDILSNVHLIKVYLSDGLVKNYFDMCAMSAANFYVYFSNLFKDKPAKDMFTYMLDAQLSTMVVKEYILAHSDNKQINKFHARFAKLLMETIHELEAESKYPVPLDDISTRYELKLYLSDLLEQENQRYNHTPSYLEKRLSRHINNNISFFSNHSLFQKPANQNDNARGSKRSAEKEEAYRPLSCMRG